MEHIWMSHVTHVNQTWQTASSESSTHMLARMNTSWHTCEWVMAPMWKSHDKHVNRTWQAARLRIRARARSHMWMNHGTRMNVSWNTCERVMANMWIKPDRQQVRIRAPATARFSHPDRVLSFDICNTSWHIYEWDNVTCLLSSCLSCRITSHLWFSHITHMIESYQVSPVLMYVMYITLMIQSCHTYDSVMSHTHAMNAACIIHP